MPLYLSLWSSLVFVLAVPGFVLARLLVTGRYANHRPAVIIATSLAGTYAIVTYAALFRFPAYATFLCLAAAAVLLIPYDQARPRAAVADLYSLRALAAGLLACVILVGCLWFFWRITPAIFPGSDTAATWNTWTKQWAVGQFPNAYGYPQFAPAIWGSIYVWLGEPLQYGPTYLFILLLILPPAAAVMWSGERNPSLSLWMIGIYGAFVAHFRGWLGGTVVASFPDWLVVSFVASALVIVGPRLFGKQSRQDDDSLALTTAQVYLCAAASIKPLSGLLVVALLISSGLLRFREARTDLYRSIVTQLLVVGLAVATFMTYYVRVTNTVVLPSPKSANFLGQMADGAGSLAAAVFPVFLVLSVWGLAATALSSRLWPFAAACAAGFAIWARTASYDPRNVLPFVIASVLFGVCGVAKVIQDYEPLKRHAERLLVPAGRKILVPPFVTLLAFGLIVTAATLPLMKPDDEIRRAFLRDNRSTGLGSKVNAMAIEAAKDGCWIGTNNADLFNQEELATISNKLWFNQLGVDETGLRAGLAKNCAVVVVLTSSLSETARQFLVAQQEKGHLRHGSKFDWEIYASSTITFPAEPL